MAFIVGESYVVDENFVGEEASELSVTKGQMVTIIEELTDANPGWILVSSGSQSGYVPADFLLPGQQAAQVPTDSYAPNTSNPFAATQAYGAPVTNDGGFLTSNFDAAPPPAIGLEPDFGTPPSQDIGISGNAAEIYSAAPQTTSPSEFWVSRDAELGFVHYPSVSPRRWYYRDIFQDIQGPFNAEEMKQRISARHIKGNTNILAETGSGATSSFYEVKLSVLFPDMAQVFNHPPVLPLRGDDPLWYFVDGQRCEQGPFSSEQMKFWIDQGFFSSETTVRKADGSSQRQAVFQFFDDPVTAFPFSGESKNREASNRNLGPAVTLTAASSGRDLLAAVFGDSTKNANANPVPEGAPMPPPAHPHPGAEPEKEKFEKVDMHEEKQEKEEKDKDFKVYGGGWGTFAGIPSISDAKQKQYAASLYTFVTRPLHPDADTVKAYIRRDVEGAHLNFSKYVVYLEDTKTPIMAAFRNRNLGSSYYEIKLNTTGKVSDITKGLTIARLEVNFSGTDFLLHNAVAGHTGVAKDLACVIYERSRGPSSSKGPRKMRCGIPDIKDEKPEFVEWRHKGKSSSMQVALKSLQVEKGIIPLLNKPPTWNAKKRAYTLSFHGRVKVSSVKNFQLVDALNDPGHKTVLMQHGRVSQVQFSMDTKHPLSLLQSFAFALSSLHAKKLVD